MKRKNVCNSQEKGVCSRRRCAAIVNHYAIVNLLRRVNLLQHTIFSTAGSSVPGSVPEQGVSERVSHGVFRGHFGPPAPECPRSVLDTPGTLGTLSGHCRAGSHRVPETPRGTLPWTPPFSETLSGTLPGHFGPEGSERLL